MISHQNYPSMYDLSRSAGTWGFYARFASGNDFGAAARTHRHTLQPVKACTAVYQRKVQLTDGKRKRHFRYVEDMCVLHTY